MCTVCGTEAPLLVFRTVRFFFSKIVSFHQGAPFEFFQYCEIFSEFLRTIGKYIQHYELFSAYYFKFTFEFQDHTNIIGILHLAAVRGSREILDIIMSKGATVDLRSGQQETPLHFACRRGVLATVRYLIEHGADVHAVDEQENTTAHFAAHAGSGLILELLFQLGVNLNARNASGQTVAHILCQFSNIACLQFLLKHRRIDPNVKDANGLNALDFAIRFAVSLTMVLPHFKTRSRIFFSGVFSISVCFMLFLAHVSIRYLVFLSLQKR